MTSLKGLKTVLAATFAAAFLAACAGSQPTYYYTLLPSSAGKEQAAGQPPSAGYAVLIESVAVPEQVDRPQIVLTDPQSTQVVPLNSSLWASPLPDELRRALADDLYRRLGVLNLASTGVPEGLPAWKLFLDIQRFESLYDQEAVIDASWRLTPVNQPSRRETICRAEARVPVGQGMSALVTGHQQALQLLAGLMAAQLQKAGPPAADDSRIQLKGCANSPVKKNQG